MYALLGDELVQFSCDDEQAKLMLGLLFDSWPWQFMELPGARNSSARVHPIIVQLQLVATVECQSPAAHAVLHDRPSQTVVYENDTYWHLCFANKAVSHVPKDLPVAGNVMIKVEITSGALRTGRLEDIVFSSLAPVFRTRGLFLVHAFAVEKDEKAVLLVGQSGSGKTTTGLSLIAQGWRYLANDVVIIKEEDGLVRAWPTPGGIGIDANSCSLLGDLPASLNGQGDLDGKRYFPASRFVKEWSSSAAPITRVLFPVIKEDDELGLFPMTTPVTLAKLMEGSIDRWDLPNLEAHMRVLTLLSGQAKGFELHLNRDLDRLPIVLEQ